MTRLRFSWGLFIMALVITLFPHWGIFAFPEHQKTAWHSGFMLYTCSMMGLYVWHFSLKFYKKLQKYSLSIPLRLTSFVVISFIVLYFVNYYALIIAFMLIGWVRYYTHLSLSYEDGFIWTLQYVQIIFLLTSAWVALIFYPIFARYLSKLLSRR